MSTTVARRSVGWALRHLGFRQTIRGALIIGAIAGLTMGAQGAAYAQAFPDQESRTKLVSSIQSVTAFNFLSGEVANAGSPASYALYKSLATMFLVTGVWGLLTATRLLRGNEEEGRMELLAAGITTKRYVSGQLLLGYLGSFGAACLIAFVIIAALGANPQVRLSTSASALMVAAVFLPGLFFAGLGVLTSQLALTRGRAVLYALVPLLILLTTRGAANSITSLNWLKQYSPFGWSDLLNPVLGARPVWIVPTIVLTTVFVGLGLFWSGIRDLGSALLRQSEAAKPRLYLLHSAQSFAIRTNRWSFMWWTIGIALFAAFFAALANLSVDLINDSPTVRQALTADSATTDQIKLLFMGVGTLFTSTALLVMATMSLAAIRKEEAKGYLDNILVQPTSRTGWLIRRLLLIVAVFTAIALLSGVVLWGVARLNDISISLWLVIQGSVSLVGALAVTLGIGTLLYGFAPRLAVAAMSAFIGWAFVLDVLKSFFHLSGALAKTSFLYYVPSNPSKAPDWIAIICLVVIGFGLAAFGILRFGVRDIVNE